MTTGFALGLSLVAATGSVALIRTARHPAAESTHPGGAHSIVQDYNCRAAIVGSAAEKNEKVKEPNVGIKIRLYRSKDWKTTYVNGGWLSWIGNQNPKAAKTYPIGEYQNGCLYLTKLAGANHYKAGLVFDGANQIGKEYPHVVVCEKAHDHDDDVKPKRGDLSEQCNDKRSKLHISFVVAGASRVASMDRPQNGWTQSAIEAALSAALPDGVLPTATAEVSRIAASVLTLGDWYPCGANRCCKVFG